MVLVYIEMKQVANSNKAVTEQTIYIRPEQRMKNENLPYQ